MRPNETLRGMRRAIRAELASAAQTDDPAELARLIARVRAEPVAFESLADLQKFYLASAAWLIEQACVSAFCGDDETALQHAVAAGEMRAEANTVAVWYEAATKTARKRILAERAAQAGRQSAEARRVSLDARRAEVYRLAAGYMERHPNATLAHLVAYVGPKLEGEASDRTLWRDLRALFPNYFANE